MTEGIEINFDEDEGHLRLDCGEEEFRQIQDLVVTGASAADRLSPFVGTIRSIVVRRMTAAPETPPKRVLRGFRAFLVLLAVCVSLVIQVIGIIAVARWLLGRGS